MKKSQTIYQIKIQVKNVKPSIFRTILVEDNIKFEQLHQNIQTCFGLLSYHLWEFQYGDFRNPTRIGHFLPKDDLMFPDEQPDFDSQKTKISDILKKEKDKITYWYDFGDDWVFAITVQKIFPKSEIEPKIKKFPHLQKAKGPMLLEDCGGIHFFGHIISLYDHLEKGNQLSKEEKEDAMDLRWKVLSDGAEEKDWADLYITIISELYETDWEDFDFEENYFSILD